MAITKATQPTRRPPARSNAKKPRTIASLVEDFLIDHRSQQHSEKTIDWHRSSLRQLLRFLETQQITDPLDLETSHLRHWVVWLNSEESLELRPGQRQLRPRAKRTVQTYCRSAHAFCKWLLHEGYIQEDVTDHFTLPKTGKPLIRVLEDEEFSTLLEACEDPQYPRVYALRNQALLWLLIDTGIRIAELADLSFQRINFREGVLEVHGKGDKERRIAMGTNALHVLRRYLEQSRPQFPVSSTTDKLFVGDAGPLTVRGIQQVIIRLKRRAGLGGERISAHIFRHTFAVRYLMLGGDPFSLQELLGHEDMETIRNYMHLNDIHIQTQKRKFSPGDHLSIPARPTRRKNFRKE